MLAVGTSFNELDTAGWDTQALLNDRLVHIASSVGSFDRSPMAYLHVMESYSIMNQKEEGKHSSLEKSQEGYLELTKA